MPKTITLQEIIDAGIEYITYASVWFDSNGNVYKLKEKTPADTIEFEILPGKVEEYISC